ncbi:indolepyruvate oxidoreductase [Candidatus Wirthbacteria bacterium CG2_30_54_11]|uniref:Indolepyruvate oxidoreductase n=1 Tax=Candidatus Wirthbacteria bacterium CG2_30_54_11 TaxID=1817892 RepID=A0A1J5IL68_9BACT|nr:MAG: indolepyruvate oxidoreductase [Candidatus Wirthbacteria bacterium CG2_30_54_11]
MKYDIILAGVGGQGVLTIAAVLDRAAHAMGLYFKQCEVHGISQRGGAVKSHVRISSEQIASDLIPEGTADLIVSTEPLESLRYLSFLSPAGRVITSSTSFRNMANYPDETQLLAAIEALPRAVLLDGGALATQAGSLRSQNLVMLGALLPFVELDKDEVEKQIEALFTGKSETVRTANLKAFRLGYEASSAVK